MEVECVGGTMIGKRDSRWIMTKVNGNPVFSSNAGMWRGRISISEIKFTLGTEANAMKPH